MPPKKQENIHDEAMEILEKIRKKIDYKNQKAVELYKNGRLLLKADNLTELRKLIEEKIETPKRDIQVWVVSYGINPKNKNPFAFSVVEYHIDSEDLNLYSSRDDLGKVIFYTKEELIKYSFKNEHIKKLIKALKNNKINMNPFQEDTFETLNKIRYT